MKNQKRFHAKNLYLHTGLSKSEIASRLDIDRKTLYLWVREGAWDRLKMSAENIPALVAEQCYFLIGRLSSYLLSDMRDDMPTTLKEADTIHKLALSINKLKNRSTANESMEMFTFFLEGLKKKNPDAVNIILPYVEDFISARSKTYLNDFLPPEFNEHGLIPRSAPRDFTEQKLDEQNYNEIYNNMEPAPSEKTG